MRTLKVGLRRRACALAIALVAMLGIVLCACLGTPQQAWADDAATGVDLGAPAHSKTLSANGDGTYTLTLDVTGKSQASQEKTKANVIVVLDVSKSMVMNKVDGSTRLDVAKSAVSGLAKTLLALNTTDNSDAVQMALVTFADSASIKNFGDSSWCTSYTDFQDVLNDLPTSQGTNWEAALIAADSISGDGDPTYVVFVSDGEPTRWVGDSGKIDTTSTPYNKALDDAKKIVDGGKAFYAVSAFGTVSNMQSLVNYAYTGSSTENAPSGHYFEAANQNALNAAFGAIIDDIEKNFTYTDVAITDKVTDLTATGIDGTTTDFVYEKNGETWDEAPAATFKDGVVTWNLGTDFKLENGVTYSVSFKVWPNQKAFDTVAALTNGTPKWDAENYPNIVQNDDGTYSVYTNESAILYYKQVDTVDGEDTKSEEKTAAYSRPTMPVPVSALTIEKEWDDSSDDSNRPDSVELGIIMDNSTESYMSVELSKGNNWKKQVYLAPGLVADGKVLEKGHVYSVVEPDIDVHYELESNSFNPMIVGNKLVANYGSNATENSGVVITAKNILKGNLSITKTVSARADLKPDPDTEFTVKVSFSKDDSAWVPGEADGVTCTIGDIHASFPTDGVFTLKAGESVVISNLPAGVGYVVSEENIPDGFALDNTNSTGLIGAIAGNSTSSARLVNTYDVEPLKVNIPVKKVLDVEGGLTPPDITGNYTFTLTAADDTPMPTTTVLTNPDANGGTVTFGEITFTAPGSYVYTVAESGQIKGVTNDAVASKKVTVDVSDKGDGTLSAAVSSTVDAPLTFTNTYSVNPTTATITAKKVLENANLAAGAFNFTLTPVDGAPMPASSGATNTADGTVAFGEITYSKPGDYTYTITETAGSATYFKYDNSAKTVAVSVVDNSDGTMTATVTGGGANATFTNTYKASSDEVFISAVKKVNGVAAGKNIFEFTLAAPDGTPMPTETTITNNGGSVIFGPIKYDIEDVFADSGLTEKTFTYTISEKDGNASGYTYDSHSETVKVTVTDKGDGTLETEVSYDTDGAVFNNAYEASGEVMIEAAKILTGADLVEGQFEFGLFEGDTEVTTAVNNGDGSIRFSVGYVLDDERSDIGTHSYTVRELVDTPQTGYTYDSAFKNVTVKVSDNGDGTLKTEVSYDDDMTFVNSYKPLPTDVALEAEKILSGRDLIAGEFSFKIEDEDGTIVSSGTNDASGAIAFSAIPLTEEGVYTFIAYEEKGSAEGITYDDSRFVYKVTVVDEGGQLQVGGIEVEEDVVFSNTYTPSEPVLTVLSRTGDSGIAAVIAAIAAVAAFTALFSAKRARERY